MAIPATTKSRPDAYQAITHAALIARNGATSALAQMQAGNVDTDFAYRVLDQTRTFIAQMNLWKNVSGLDSYFTTNVPGYVGVITTDIDTSITAAQAILNWLVANFPRDTTNTWLLASQLNADGTRTLRQFTSVQTAGLQTLMQNFLTTVV